MTRMVLAGLMLTSVTHSTAEDWAPPTANKKDIQDVLFGRYQLENKKSSDEWKKLQSVLAPGAGSGASLAAYKLTNKNEAEIKKILDSYGFKPTYAKTGSKKFLKFVRKTPVRGFLFVVTVYEGVVSAYNFYESPNAVGKPDLRRLEFPEESQDCHLFPLSSR